MTLDELKLQVEKDLIINDERLDTESLRNQELYSKYLDYKTNFELLLHRPLFIPAPWPVGINHAWGGAGKAPLCPVSRCYSQF